MNIKDIRAKLAGARKALVALAALIVAAGGTEVADDKWWANLIVVLAGAVGVWAVPNKTGEV